MEKSLQFFYLGQLIWMFVVTSHSIHQGESNKWSVSWEMCGFLWHITSFRGIKVVLNVGLGPGNVESNIALKDYTCDTYHLLESSQRKTE